jgi:hypothetical protein
MLTRLGWVFTIFGLLAVLSVSGVIPIDRPMGGFVFAVSLLTAGFLAVFKTEEVISPLFRSSRWSIIALKVVGWWRIVLGSIYAIGLVMGMFRLLFS